MKKLFVLAAFLVAFALQAQEVPNQFFYEECDWFVEQEYTYCSQDWFLFAYWPLECTEACQDAICLGLFPSGAEDATYDLPDDVYCCEFIVTGQFMWLFDAIGSTDYTNAGGVTANFNWSHSTFIGGPWTLIVNGDQPGPLGQYTLDNDLTGGVGAHYFQICATDVTIPANFNGQSDFTTTMGFIYSM